MCKRITKIICSLCLVLFTLCACQESYHIKGNIINPGVDGLTISLKVFKENKMQVIDSAKVENGCFAFKGAVDSLTMAVLYLDEAFLFPVVLQPGDIVIDMNEENPRIGGTAYNDSLFRYIQQKDSFQRLLDELPRKETHLIMDGLAHDTIVSMLAQEEDEINQSIDQFIARFISSHFDDVLGTGVFMLETIQMPYPILTSLIETILPDATPRFIEHAYVKEYVRVAKENMKTLEENQ